MGTLDGLILIHNSVFGLWKDQVRHQLMRRGTYPAGSDDDRQSADGVVRLSVWTIRLLNPNTLKSSDMDHGSWMPVNSNIYRWPVVPLITLLLSILVAPPPLFFHYSVHYLLHSLKLQNLRGITLLVSGARGLAG